MGVAKMALVAAVSLAWCGVAHAGQEVPDYDFEWAVIGDPGNRPTQPHEVRDFPDTQLGAVAYRYRIATTEVTVGQWWEFVHAYQPFVAIEERNSPEFLGFGILPVGNGYELRHDTRSPTVMSWEYAARYVNWLHNGKSLSRDDFENGVYDTSTFTSNTDGSWNHQLTRNPEARFWIPSLDEWTKAAHWDPNKNGPGAGGYWYYPTSMDSLPLSGFPEHGGMTNAGNAIPFGTPPMPVGSYPDVTSPWGLFDLSGGVQEMNETVSSIRNRSRSRRGSQQGDPIYQFADGIEYHPSLPFYAPVGGLRVAGVVPSPSSAIVGCAFCVFVLLRRKRDESWREYCVPIHRYCRYVRESG